MRPPEVRGGGRPDITPDSRPASRTITSPALTREPSARLTIADCAVQGIGVERVRQALADHDCTPRGSALRLRARCPVHGSQGPTLAVSQGRAGAMLKCHAGCETADVLAAIGLCWDDMFDAPRERAPGWTPRRRPVADPMAELKRVFRRAVQIINLRSAQEAYRESCPMPELSVDERIELAIWGEKRDQDAHYWRTVARWAALAADETYVRPAYAQRAKWLRTGKYGDKPSPEQDAVLSVRAEDVERERARIGGAA